MTRDIRIALLDPHPDNPRLELRENVIAAIRAQLKAAGKYDQMHAIIVRPLGRRFQIIAGHHRVEAAEREGIQEIPAWVREMSDDQAFMELVLSNAQGELTPLERGRHALAATTKYGAKNGNGEKGISIAKYAELTGRKNKQSVDYEICAYEVFEKCQHMLTTPEKYFRHFVAIHAAPSEHWAKLAERMADQGWTVQQTQAEIARLWPKKQPAPKPKPLITTVSLTQWKAMEKEQQADVMKWRERGYTSRFNEQKNDNVEWAKSTNNPVTGCLHNCPYCYAREIAEGNEKIYPEGFEPVLHLDRLMAPYITPVPAAATADMSYRNVFVCSMADLFGQWTPAEWIEAVLQGVRENPQWTFLFLTKFPIRMAEFEYPDNAWLGTTVDLQARVANAERAMRKVKASVKWLSLEPLIEPLQFEDLSTFQWVVIGGASPVKASSTGPTPEWIPPRRWVYDLTMKAWDAGCMVYHKTNLNNDRLRTFPFDPNAKPEPAEAPAVFKYLKVIA